MDDDLRRRIERFGAAQAIPVETQYPLTRAPQLIPVPPRPYGTYGAEDSVTRL